MSGKQKKKKTKKKKSDKDVAVEDVALAAVADSIPGLPAPKGPPAYAKKANREGCVMLGTWIPFEMRQQLKLLAAEQGKTMEELTFIAFNRLFAKYKKPRIIKKI